MSAAARPEALSQLVPDPTGAQTTKALHETNEYREPGAGPSGRLAADGPGGAGLCRQGSQPAGRPGQGISGGGHARARGRPVGGRLSGRLPLVRCGGGLQPGLGLCRQHRLPLPGRLRSLDQLRGPARYRRHCLSRGQLLGQLLRGAPLVSAAQLLDGETLAGLWSGRLSAAARVPAATRLPSAGWPLSARTGIQATGKPSTARSRWRWRSAAPSGSWGRWWRSTATTGSWGRWWRSTATTGCRGRRWRSAATTGCWGWRSTSRAAQPDAGQVAIHVDGRAGGEGRCGRRPGVEC
jgi:hypothetical protein